MMLTMQRYSTLLRNNLPKSSCLVRQAPRMQMQPFRSFANIDFDAVKPENSVLKFYTELVNEGQIRADPNQLAVVEILDQWQQGFTA